MLTFLRGRPWLAACVITVAIGLSILASSRHGYLLFWAGILAIAGGLLAGLAGELGHRRDLVGQRAVTEMLVEIEAGAVTPND